MAICKNGHRISLLIESGPGIGLQTFSKVVRTGSKGICISRLHPDYVEQKFDLKGSERYWLSDCNGKDALSPRALEHLSKVIRSSVTKGPSTAVLLDGLEYILLYNDIFRVLAFLDEVDLALAKGESEMVVCVDPITFEPRELDRLYGAFPRCSPEEMVLTLVSPRSHQNAPSEAGSTDSTT